MIRDGPALNVVYSEVKRVFDFQHDEIDKLDAKAGLLLGAAAVTLAVLLQAGLGHEEFHKATVAVLSAAIAFIAASAVTAVLALRVREFMQVPNPRVLAQDHLSSACREAKMEVLRDFVRVYFETKTKVDEKGTWLTRTERLLMSGVILVGLAFIVEVI